LTNKYQVTKLFETLFRTESETYNLEVSVDSLGLANLTFGPHFSMRLDYSSMEQLETILKECRAYIENETIDLAGQIKLPIDGLNKAKSQSSEPDAVYHNDSIDW
jgi:hypothetical protein